MSNTNLIGAPEAARRCGMSRRGFLYAIERGDVKATRLSGGRNTYVIEESELDRFAQERLAARHPNAKIA